MKHFTCKPALIYSFVAAFFLITTTPKSYSQQAWTRVPSPDTSTTRNLLNGLTGASSSDLWAVGHFETTPAGNLRNYILHWNGGGWQIFNGTDLSNSYNDLQDVTAITANDVWAVGSYNDPGTTRSQLLHWNGSAWSHSSLPNIPGGSYLSSIDATAANDIWAVGAKAGSPTAPAYTIHYNGSTWTEFPAANPGSFRNLFNAVDGLTSNDVWAVGFLSNSYGDFHAMAQHWNGSSWSNVTLPSSISAPLGDLSSVTMISSNDVWAAGSTLTGNKLLIHWDGASWSEMSTVGFSGGAIVARGTDIFSVGDKISQWNGSNWTIIEPLTQLSYPSLITATAFSNGDVWAAGRTFDTAFHTLVYRTANATPQFIHGNSQTISAAINSSPQNIDEMLKVEDADLSQVVIYTTLTPPSHGTLSGLPDTAITNNGFAKPLGVTYTPAQNYSGTDQYVIKVSVGPLNSQVVIDAVISGALPVLISDYDVTKSGATALMQWTSQSEVNAKEFVMERSADGVNFTAINRTSAKGSGYNYKLIDPSPVLGLNYYRLQQIDIDGRATNFSVKTLKFDNSELKLFILYPNPVIGKELKLQLNVPGNNTITLYNLNGQEIMKKVINDSSPLVFVKLPDNITPGIYIFLLTNSKASYSEKVFIR